MPKTILIVEDFEDTRKMMRFLLEDMGFEVLEAEDGWKALESVKLRVPDLIFMDMALPQINGLSATKLIRQIEEAANVPIIAFTASGEFLKQSAIEAGCNDFISKPLDIAKLQPVIEQYIS